MKCTVEDLRAFEEVKKRAVIYARYSSDKQKDASIEQQIKECMDYLTRKGYTLIKIYSDSAKSASKEIEKRSDFLKLIEDSAHDEFDVVVSYALDRISREEHGGFYGYENALNNNGVRIEYATQVFDDGYGGEISKAVHVTMAAEYVAQLRKNVVRGMRDNVQNGRYNGGASLPIGMKVVGEGKKNKRYAPDEKTSPYIKRAFEMYVSGATTGEIADYLNDNSVRTTKGTKIRRDTVNRMLANPIYIGTKISTFDNKVEHKVYTTEGICDPIISEDLWYKTQVVRESRRFKGATEGSRVKYILRGKLFCGICGTEMVADNGRSGNGNMYYYYTCEKRKHKKGAEKCKKKNVPKNNIEETIIDIITNLIWDEEKILLYTKAAEEAISRHVPNPRIAELENEIKLHTQRKERAANCYLDTGDRIWYDSVNDETRIINESMQELAIAIRNDEAPKEAADFIAEIEALRNSWAKLVDSDEGREQLVKNYIERIDVYDPTDDDPDKYRLDVILRTDTTGRSAEEVTTEVKISVRKNTSMGHQHKTDSSKESVFPLFIGVFGTF